MKSMEDHIRENAQLMNTYVGIDKECAVEQAKEDGWWDIHIAREDEATFPMSASFNFGRVSFTIENNVVTEASVG